MAKYNRASFLGKRFNTGNSTVQLLEEGTLLEVVGKGQLEVVDEPEQVFEPEEGDRIMTKYGPATVVRLSSVELNRGVIYIADGTTVVRSAYLENVSPV